MHCFLQDITVLMENSMLLSDFGNFFTAVLYSASLPLHSTCWTLLKRPHHPSFTTLITPFLFTSSFWNVIFWISKAEREETNAPSWYLNPGGTSFVICPQNGCSLAIDKHGSGHLWFIEVCRNIPHFLCTCFISVSTWNKKAGHLHGLGGTWWPL